MANKETSVRGVVVSASGSRFSDLTKTLTGLFSSNQLSQLVNISQAVPIARDPDVSAGQRRVPARARRLSAQEQTKIIFSYQAGNSMAEVAREYGVLQQTISELLRRNGIPIREQRAIGKEEIAKAAELYADGHSLAGVGRQIGYDAETIRRHLKRRGVALRSRSTRRP